MAQQTTQDVSPRLKQVIRLVERMSAHERRQLKTHLVRLEKLSSAEAAMQRINEQELKAFLRHELGRLGPENQPWHGDEPFLGGLTVAEYFALPDEEQERIWNEAEMEFEEPEERDVRSDAYISARQKCS